MREKKFEIKVTVNIPKDLAEFLDDLVSKGVAESVSQAVRKCIALCKSYMPELTFDVVRVREGEKKSDC